MIIEYPKVPPLPLCWKCHDTKCVEVIETFWIKLNPVVRWKCNKCDLTWETNYYESDGKTFSTASLFES